MNRKLRRATAKRSDAPGPARSQLTEEGLKHQLAGRLDRARTLYLKALAVRPDDAGALYLLGILRHQEGRSAEAVELIAKAIAIQPNQAEMRCNLGVTLAALGRFDEAVDAYRDAIAIKPDYADALNNLGNALCELNRHEEALASYDRALAIQPYVADVLNNRGNALCGLDRHDDALAWYDRALAIQPDYAHALNNLGAALRTLNRHEEAVAAYQHLLNAKHDYDYGRGNLLDSKLNCCDWKDYGSEVTKLETDVVAGKRVVAPFVFLSLSASAGAQLKCARTYGEDKFPRPARYIGNGERYRHAKIRLAYVSADFHDHATSHLMAGLFESHDKSRFETTAISFGPDKEDASRARVRNAFDRFFDVRGNSDRDSARMIKELEIDIAVDLKGFTQHSRPGILALRPSPIQVNFLGYPGTIGADFIDYILADRVVIPENQQQYYAEKVVYLPYTYQANDSKRRIGDIAPTRRAAGLPENGFVFCSFNKSYKITPPVFDVWMRLLRAVEGSVLWLLDCNAAAVRNLRGNAEQRGVAAARLVFARSTNPEDHLARHRLADVFLDSAPYNAHTTASDALWAGLPVVTSIGSSFAGRVAASLLNAVGLPELIAGDLEAYEATALRLARDSHALSAIKAKLEQNRQAFPLFDTARFSRDIESAYETMWERRQRDEPPASFAVAASDGGPGG